MTFEYQEKQRVSQPSHKKNRKKFVLDQSSPFKTTATPSLYGAMYNRYREAVKQQCNTRIGWSDVFKDMSPAEVQQFFVKIAKQRRPPHRVSAHNVYTKAMPKPDLPPVYPDRPLNLNEDGTTIANPTAVPTLNTGCKPMLKR